MPLSDQEREEIAAVRDSDGRGLPIQAIIASQRWLAERLIDSDDELRAIDKEAERLSYLSPMEAEAAMIIRRIRRGIPRAEPRVPEPKES